MKQPLLHTVLWMALMLITVSAMGQIISEEERNPDIKSENMNSLQRPKPERLWKWDNFFVGGIPGFGISNNYASITVAAEAGYFLHPHISVGGRFVYQFYLDKFYSDRLHIFGGGPFVRGYIWKGIFAQGEYETTSVGNLRIEDSFGNVVGYARLNVNAFLLGGGYHDNYDDGFGYYIAVLFNVINTETFIYPNPVFRFGLTYNFLQR